MVAIDVDTLYVRTQVHMWMKRKTIKSFNGNKIVYFSLTIAPIASIV